MKSKKVEEKFRAAMDALDECHVDADLALFLGAVARELIERGLTRDMTYPPTCKEGHPVCPSSEH